MPFFDHAHPKIIKSTFSFPEFVPAWKNDFIPSVHFWAPRPDWSHPFLTMHTQKFFDQLWIFVIMYQHAKKNCLYIPSVILQIQKILGCPITRMVTPIFDHAHLKNWPYSFLTMPHQNLFNQLSIFEKHFSQIEDLYRNPVNNINFHYRTNSRKINDQIFLQIQKPHLCPIFGALPYFWGQKNVFPKIWHHNLIRLSSTMSKLREI